MEKLIEIVVGAHTRLGVWPQVAQPVPQWTGPGVALLQTLAGVSLALALSIAVLGGIAAGGMIAVGHFSRNSELQSRGLKGVFGVIIAAAVLGGIAGLITWGSSLKVV